MYITKFLLAVVIFFMVLIGKALPHVGLVYPKGGETFEAGDTITVKWQELIPHGSSDWDLRFTLNAGLTWEDIAINLPKSQLTYDWTVPNVSSDLCRIRIVQDNQTSSDYNDDSNNFTITTTTDVNHQHSYVEDFILYPAYPNPFNPITHIKYSIPEQSFVTLKIYDILGNEITTLADGEKSAGDYDVEINAVGWTSGIYFYNLQASSINSDSKNNFFQAKKLILLK
jgi:hypothetical protein